MKKSAIVLITITIFILNYFCIPKAYAEGDYARIVSEKAMLFSDASYTLEKFYIPEGYFVKIIKIGSDYSCVSYMGETSGLPLISGYVANVYLDFNSNTENLPYPKQTLSLRSDEVMFSDSSKSEPKAVLLKGTTASLYGFAEISGEIYLYIYAYGSVGYIKESSVEAFELTKHPTYMPLSETLTSSTIYSNSAFESAEPKSNVEENPIDATKLLIIGAIIIGVLCLFYLVLRPDKWKQSEHSYYGDKDD